MLEDKQCDGCYWRRPDWRDGGWCYMFKERFEGCAQQVAEPMRRAALSPVTFAALLDVRRHLNERDREDDPSARETGDGDYPGDRYDR